MMAIELGRPAGTMRAMAISPTAHFYARANKKRRVSRNSLLHFCFSFLFDAMTTTRANTLIYFSAAYRRLRRHELGPECDNDDAIWDEPRLAAFHTIFPPHRRFC